MSSVASAVDPANGRSFPFDAPASAVADDVGDDADDADGDGADEDEDGEEDEGGDPPPAQAVMTTSALAEINARA